jgi:hypothetical protein
MFGDERNKSAAGGVDKKWFIVIAAVILSFAFAGAAMAGTTWLEKAKLLASDGTSGDEFGYFVSVSGDYAIVGASYDSDKGTDSGSAYIFRRDGANWVQQAKLTASDGAAYDRFGISVSISGDYAIVGVCDDDDKGINSGSAYIFNKFCPRADLNDDCKVDFADFAIFADWWLYGTD